MSKTFYITTPIYYVNDKPHVGTGLTTLIADAVSRFQRAQGKSVFFLTGTDENAPKVAAAAQKAGKDPQVFVDEMASVFERYWQTLNIRYDIFMRTTRTDHKRAVQRVFQQLLAKGDVYAGDYEGWYCISCETFWTGAKVEEERLCLNAECRKPLEHRKERSYFLRLSAYAERLRDYIQANPRFIEPETRRNEVLSFIAEGLQDVAISRLEANWGTPVPGEDNMVIYVWFDALINYLTATGWGDNGVANPDLWPPDLQLMGKDILPRFHATIWPATLMALELPLPKQLFGHGWWLFKGEKISKSKTPGGLADPLAIVQDLSSDAQCEERFAVDALRYYMLREMPTQADTNFSVEGLEARYNADLANDLGNLLHRTLSMTHRYLDGRAPNAELEPEIAAAFQKAVRETATAFNETQYPVGLQAAWEIIRAVNHYYDSRAPWNLAKQGDLAGVGQTLYAGLEASRILSIILSPVMPSVCEAIAGQLNLPYETRWSEAEKLKGIPVGHTLNQPTPIFPRLKPKAEAPANPEKKPPQEVRTMDEMISIDEFKKIKIRVARVTAAEPHPNANKLLKLTVSLGDETRTIVAGIAESHTPDQLVGRQVLILANLQPATLRGVVSEGMLLAADIDGKAILLSPEIEVPDGTGVR